MYLAKIILVKGRRFIYLLRRVQSSSAKEPVVPAEAEATLKQCQTIEQLLDFFFSTDFRVDEAFIRLFEKRMQELECPF